ncbi:MAG TPA: response regulator transcription factor, partial [Thermoanaerobaculales bacterium]|nr:response regulator transcription factor [Thermoanaerobaculales bacterium]
TELNEAIRIVTRGGRYLSPSIVDIVVEDYAQRLSPALGSALEKLSVREREVLQMIAEGHSTAAIAERLHVSRKTVETHRKNMMAKLELRNVAELTKFAIREGLTSLDISTRKGDETE